MQCQLSARAPLRHAARSRCVTTVLSSSLHVIATERLVCALCSYDTLDDAVRLQSQGLARTHPRHCSLLPVPFASSRHGREVHAADRCSDARDRRSRHGEAWRTGLGGRASGSGSSPSTGTDAGCFADCSTCSGSSTSSGTSFCADPIHCSCHTSGLAPAGISRCC